MLGERKGRSGEGRVREKGEWEEYYERLWERGKGGGKVKEMEWGRIL